MSDTILSNSIWPNGMKTDSEGYACFYPLGTKKIPVPTSSSEWPKGNKLVSPFVYQDDKLVGFVDTKALRAQQPTTIYLSYEYIEADFSSIKKENLTIYAPNATTKTVIWSDTPKEIIGEVSFKYKNCKSISDIEAIDADYKTNDIVNGAWTQPVWHLEVGGNSDSSEGMFSGCDSLTSFFSDLPKLTDGNHMFQNCKNFKTFTSDLSSLIDGRYMFHNCYDFTSFSADLPSLTNAEAMFYGCYKLDSFSSDLPSLTNCNNMFAYCNSLTSFKSSLPSLTNGYNMFDDCKLDTASVKNIIDTINTYSAKLTLGMGCNNTTEDKDLFAQEIGYADMTSLLAALQAKGWTVTAQYNGRPTTTYGLRRTVEETLPVFVQLEEAEDHANYTSLDDSKKFRLTWFHETTGSTDGYTEFNSLEEAIEILNIKPIEN